MKFFESSLDVSIKFVADWACANEYRIRCPDACTADSFTLNDSLFSKVSKDWDSKLISFFTSITTIANVCSSIPSDPIALIFNAYVFPYFPRGFSKSGKDWKLRTPFSERSNKWPSSKALSNSTLATSSSKSSADIGPTIFWFSLTLHVSLLMKVGFFCSSKSFWKLIPPSSWANTTSPKVLLSFPEVMDSEVSSALFQIILIDFWISPSLVWADTTNSSVISHSNSKGFSKTQLFL